MPEQTSTDTQLINQVFHPELTQQGLAELRERFPSDVVHDMTNDEQFKAAKTARAERNKLHKGIDRVRIDFADKLKDTGDKLKEEVTKIFSPVVTQLEAEEAERKAEAERLKKEKEQRLTQEREQIEQIRGFISNCRNESAQYIADTIESVDLIDTSIFSKDLIHEAIEAKKQTLSTLMMMYEDAKAREKFQKEQAELNAQTSLMNLKSYASNCIGKTPAEIERKLEALRELPILESEYGNYVAEAADAKTQAMQLLEMMFEQAKQLEALQPKPERKTVTRYVVKKAPNTHVYTPLDVWPSDAARAESQELDHVCFKLEEAEQYITLLKGQVNAN